MAELYQSAGEHRRSLVYLVRARALSDSLGMLTKLAHVSLAEARAYAALGNLSAALRAGDGADSRGSVARARGATSWTPSCFAAELAQRPGDSAARARGSTGEPPVAASLGVGIARVRVALTRARVLDAGGRRARRDRRRSRAMAPDSALLTADEQAERDGLLARVAAPPRRRRLRGRGRPARGGRRRAHPRTDEHGRAARRLHRRPRDDLRRPRARAAAEGRGGRCVPRRRRGAWPRAHRAARRRDAIAARRRRAATSPSCATCSRGSTC